ncbi:MAG: pyruvate formate lyase family protein [Acidobacteriota bacterium]
MALQDLSLRECALTPRVTHLKQIYFRAMPEICVERPRLITRYSLDHGLFNRDRISILDKARMYRFVLENRLPIVSHTCSYEKGMKPFEFVEDSLFAGSTTTRFKGVPLYPELMALALWPELSTMSKRASNPFQITEAEAKALNEDIFPHWIDGTILELARKRAQNGKPAYSASERDLLELKLLQWLVFFLVSKPNCISHTIPDFNKAIGAGLRSMVEEAAGRAAAAADPSQKEFCQAVAEVLEGVIGYSRRLADKADSMALTEPDPVRERELLDLAKIHRRVPEYPAQSFREGITTVWICWTAIHLENPNVGLSLGRLDQVLWDLYRRDLEAGAISVEDAVELICCLWLKIGDHVPMIPETGEQLFGGSGSNQAITIGGVDRDGRDAVNDLTYVMLRATELMRLRDPNLNARYYPEVNSRDYLRRLCEVNITTGATPALHNDRAVIKALTSKGDTLEQARDYGVIGCVEPGSNGRSYGSSASILLNLTSALELTLFNGRHRHTGLDRLISIETGDPAQFRTFAEFETAFENQTRWLIDRAVALNELLGRVHQDFYPTPILSALFEGPMDKGRDLIQGGAVINSSGATIIGLADVADSLSAVRRVVFQDQAASFATLLDAIRKDFAGYETLRRRLTNQGRTPKYGNEDADADGTVTRIVELLDKAFGAKTSYRGGRYRVGYWTMTNHAGFGRLMGATPNGRKASENFTSGITPVSGVTPCLTKALNSVAGLPVQCLSNGVALNLKYTPEMGHPNRMLNSFVATVEGYFDGRGGQSDGGMEIQFNVTTHDSFADAVAHPEKYPELLVRVSGYTAYFKDLNPQMQKEIIDRTEYLLSTGRMVFYEPFPLPQGRTER